MGRGVENLRGKTTKVGGGQHLLFTVQILREARLKGAIYFWQCVDGVGHFLLTFFFIAYNIKPILFWQVGLRGRFFGTRSQAKFVHHPPYPPQIMDSP